MSTDLPAQSRPARVVFYNDPKVRSIVYQIVLCAVVALSRLWRSQQRDRESRARADRVRLRILEPHRRLRHQPDADRVFVARLDLWPRLLGRAAQHACWSPGSASCLRPSSASSSALRGCRSNWLLAKLAGGYVEIIRNLPLLLQLLFWYNAVLKTLPDIRDSIVIPRRRSSQQPRLVSAARRFSRAASARSRLRLLAGIVAAIAFVSGRAGGRSGPAQQAPVLLVVLALVVGLPLAAFALAGLPLGFEYPQAGRFNISGGIEVLPEFVALLFGLSIYTAAFIAEVVRAGILAVSRGQSEAAYSLGLQPGPTLRLIVVPQAMRVIIPPLTSQYLNLTKNSSLAVAIGYPDLVQVFTGTVLNQTGQAVEVVAITMLVYLFISLVTSLLMNIYNRRMALVER